MSTSRHILFVATIFTAFALFASAAQAASIAQTGSGVDAYFGSQGTGYQDSNPANLFVSPGTGPLYTPGAPLPSLPLPPTPLVYPTTFGNPFQGSGSVSNFNDGLGGSTFAAATSFINDNYNPSGTLTSDAAIDIPFWWLYQAPNASLYAFEQLNFFADYSVIGSLAGATPNIPLFLTGSVVTGGNVQFDAQITYTWVDVNADGTLGAQTNLGTLSYQWQQAGGGAFTTTVFSSGTLAGSPSSAGILELTGYAWVAGDPFEITITPEPATMSLLTLGALGLLRRKR